MKPAKADLTEERKAEIELRRSAARARGNGGRPLKGKEPRVRVNTRLEPTVLAELHRMTGRGPGELLEAVHDLLATAAEYRTARNAVLAKVESLLLVSD